MIRFSKKLFLCICLLLLTAACTGEYCITNSPGDIASTSTFISTSNTQVYANGASASLVTCNGSPCSSTALVTPPGSLPANYTYVCTAKGCGSWTNGPSVTNATQGQNSKVLIKVSGTVNLCANDPNIVPSNCVPLVCAAGVTNCCGSETNTACVAPTLCPTGVSCNTDPMCQYGKQYSIIANKQQWQKVSDANEGDVIQITVPPPNTQDPNNTNCCNTCANCPDSGCSSSVFAACPGVESAVSNKMSWRFSTLNGGCTTPIYQTTGSTSPPNSGSYTVLNKLSSNAPDLNFGSRPCWNVAGTGLGMHIASNVESATDPSLGSAFLVGNATPLFVSNDGNANIQGVQFFGVLGDANVPVNNDLGTYYNRISTQTIDVTNGYGWQLGLIFQDLVGAYGDNLGGTNVYVIRQCTAQNGAAQSGNSADGSLVMQVLSGQTTQSVALTKISADCSDVPSDFSSYCKAGDSTANYYTASVPSGKVQYQVQTTNNNAVAGTLSVTTYTETKVGLFSKLVSDVVSNIQTTLSTSVKDIYNNMVGEASYIQYLRVLLTLYILLYGVFFLLGITQISQMDLVIRLIKIGVIVAITSPNSWDFFNNNFFSLYTNGSSDIIGLFEGSDPGFVSGNAFGFVDNTFAILIYDYRTWLRILALVVTTPLGFVYVFFIISGIGNYFFAIMEAVIVYIMSILAVQILLVLAPIFIPFMMFGITKHLFTSWLQFLFAFSIKPVLLLIGLSILSTVLYILVIELFSFPVCLGCAIPIFLKPIQSVINDIESVVGNLGNFFFCIPWLKPWGFSEVADGSSLGQVIGWEISSILLFVLITSLMKKMPTFVGDMTERLTGTRNISLQVGRGGGVAGKVVNSLKNATLGVIGMDKASKDRRKTANRREGPSSPAKDLGVKASDVGNKND